MGCGMLLDWLLRKGLRRVGGMSPFLKKSGLGTLLRLAFCSSSSRWGPSECCRCCRTLLPVEFDVSSFDVF